MGNFSEKNVGLKPAADNRIQQLIKKGVNIPNPLTIDVGEEVKIDQISGKGSQDLPRMPDLRGENGHFLRGSAWV